MKHGGIIYLDNNATTRPLPEVVEAMRPFQESEYANPSSIHQFGQTARHAVECARAQVAELIGASPKEIIFTSGGTESINLGIRGVLEAQRTALTPALSQGERERQHSLRREREQQPSGRSSFGGSGTSPVSPHAGRGSPHPGPLPAGEGVRRRRLVTTAVEHSAVLRVAEQLEAEGYGVEYVGVDHEGRLDDAEWAEKLAPDTALASILHANNETGVMWDVSRLAAVAAERGIPVHVDAVQSAGKVPIDVTSWPVQLVSLAAHKFHGPKGVGALYVRRRTHLAPMILGGSQERQLRGGTENVAGIVGMGVAADMARKESDDVASKVGALRDALEEGVLRAIPFVHVNGRGAERIYNTSNISFEGLESEAILILLSEAGICASSGAACSSGSLEPSHVLKAMHIDDRVAHGAIRFSLSRFNTRAEIDEVVARLPALLGRLTMLSA